MLALDISCSVDISLEAILVQCTIRKREHGIKNKYYTEDHVTKQTIIQ